MAIVARGEKIDVLVVSPISLARSLVVHLCACDNAGWVSCATHPYLAPAYFPMQRLTITWIITRHASAIFPTQVCEGTHQLAYIIMIWSFLVLLLV